MVSICGKKGVVASGEGGDAEEEEEEEGAQA